MSSKGNAELPVRVGTHQITSDMAKPFSLAECASSRGKSTKHKTSAVVARQTPATTRTAEKFEKPAAPKLMSTPHQRSSCHSKFLPMTVPRVPPACIKVKALPSHPAGVCSCWSTVTGRKVKALPNSFAAFSSRAAGRTSTLVGLRIKAFASKGTSQSFKHNRNVFVAVRPADIFFR